MEPVLRAAGGGALKHVQVREYVRTLVRDWAPGSPAPSERELVQHFGVARMTVRQAMDALVVEGLLERIPGRGTFVARPRRGVGRLASFTEDMARSGRIAESTTIVARMGQAGPGVAKALGITPGDAVIYWKRLRLVEGEPVGIEDAYLNEVLLPGLLTGTMPSSLYEELGSRGLRPTWAEDTITADVANEDEAARLGLEAGGAVLRHTRRALVGEVILQVSRTCYRPDRYSINVQLGMSS